MNMTEQAATKKISHATTVEDATISKTAHTSATVASARAQRLLAQSNQTENPKGTMAVKHVSTRAITWACFAPSITLVETSDA
jgi:hypothetical protein